MKQSPNGVSGAEREQEEPGICVTMQEVFCYAVWL